MDVKKEREEQLVYGQCPECYHKGEFRFVGRDVNFARTLRYICGNCYDIFSERQIERGPVRP